MDAATRFRKQSSVEHCQTCEQRRQRIMQHASTFRQRSGMTGVRSNTTENSVTARAIDPTKVGVFNVQFPPEAQPASEVTFSFFVSNTVEINFFAPAWCPKPLNPFANGVELAAVVLVGGQTVFESAQCVTEGGAAMAKGTFFSPADPGEYDVTIRVNVVPTGQTVFETTRTLTVTEEADQAPCADGFVRDPKTGDCVPARAGDGDGGGGGKGLLGNLTGILRLMIILLVIGTAAGTLSG